MITLLSNAENSGVSVPEDKDFTLDLNGHKLNLVEPYAGSAGTPNNGLQLLKGSTILIKNGTILAPGAKNIIQNYSNLTLENVKISGTESNKYCVSNNFGSSTFAGTTSIKSNPDQVAFDVYYGMSEVYDAGVNVTISANSVSIDGKIEYGKASRASSEQMLATSNIYIPEGYYIDPPAGYHWVPEGTKQKLAPNSST